LPFILLFVLALGGVVSAWQERDDTGSNEEMIRDFLIVFLVMVSLCVLFSFTTAFHEGRSLLFLAPFMLGCFALGYWRRFSAAAWLPLCLSSALLFIPALANARQSKAPFKRELAIPYDEMIRFIAHRVHGSVLYVSPEPVSDYLLRDSGYCILYTRDGPPPCAAQGPDRFDTVVLGIYPNFERLLDVPAVLADIQQHRTLRSRRPFGYDRWAGLKTRLTEVDLGTWIITVEIYE
jgi:hypothetical protein